MMARARARPDGVLVYDAEPLTSERVRALIDHWFIDLGYSNPPSIVASGPAGGDCHELGSGPLRTGQPTIVPDIFPRNRTSLYNGDCTRTVVHGDIPDEIARMHAAVCRARRSAMAAAKAGTTGEAVHLATVEAIKTAGYSVGLPASDSPIPTALSRTGPAMGLDSTSTNRRCWT